MVKKLVLAFVAFALLCTFGSTRVGAQTSTLITDITYNTSQQYHPGDTLTVTLTGAPGGAASFDVGQVMGISMTEVSPGVYTGSYLIPGGMMLSSAQIVGHLQRGGQSDVRSASMPLSTAPMFLAPGATVVTELKASHRETYVTTDPPYIFIKHDRLDPFTLNGLRVYYDGKDVTSFATVTEHFVAYAPPIPFSIGRHHVQLVGENSISQRFESYTWFKVEPAGAPTSSLSIPVAIVTTSNSTITATTAVPLLYPSPLSTIRVFDNLMAPANSGDWVAVTILGPPGGLATFDVGSNMGIEMTETSPGAYVGTYRVRDNDNFNNATLTGHLWLPTGEVLVGSSPTIASQAYYAGAATSMVTSPSVVISSPNNGDQLTPPFVILGTTIPNTDVILTSRAPDGTQQTLTVRSDASGNFSATVPPEQTAASGAQYIITAVPRDSSGNLGSGTTIMVVQR